LGVGHVDLALQAVAFPPAVMAVLGFKPAGADAEAVDQGFEVADRVAVGGQRRGDGQRRWAWGWRARRAEPLEEGRGGVDSEVVAVCGCLGLEPAGGQAVGRRLETFDEARVPEEPEVGSPGGLLPAGGTRGDKGEGDAAVVAREVANEAGGGEAVVV
jgi:hypothetical protein